MRYLLDTFFKKTFEFFSKVFFEDIFQAKNQKFYKKNKYTRSTRTLNFEISLEYVEK